MENRIESFWEIIDIETGIEAFGFKEYTPALIKCHNCKTEFDISDEWFKYCPECGAYMLSKNPRL